MRKVSMNERSFEEKKGDVFLKCSGWEPVDRDNLDGLWVSRSLEIGIRRGEAIEKQLQAQSASFFYWSEHAPKAVQELFGMYVMHGWLTQAGEMLQDPELQKSIVDHLAKPETREEWAPLINLIKSVVLGWVREP